MAPRVARTTEFSQLVFITRSSHAPELQLAVLAAVLACNEVNRRVLLTSAGGRVLTARVLGLFGECVYAESMALLNGPLFPFYLPNFPHEVRVDFP